MPSFTFVKLENYESLEDEARKLLDECSTEIFKSYDILKDLASKGNEKAILLREHVRNKADDGSRSLMAKQYICSSFLQKASTIAEFNKLLIKLKKLPKLARDYTRRFNTEIAVEGSGVTPIPVKSEEEIAATSRVVGVSWVDDGYDALQNFRSLSAPKNLLPNDLTAEDLSEADAEAKSKLTSGFQMIVGAPSYAYSDMRSYDILCVVNRQGKLHRALNKPITSEEDQQNLSREFHYNNQMIEVLQFYNPYEGNEDNEHDHHTDGYSSYGSNHS
jgi:hypothetical protein